MSRSDTIPYFCQYFHLSYIRAEENIHHIGNYVLYCPGSNSVIDEVLEDYQVWRSVVIPGRYCMSDGDPGYPDEYDEQQVSSHATLLAALEKIGHLTVTDYIDDEKMAEEMIP